MSLIGIGALPLITACATLPDTPTAQDIHHYELTLTLLPEQQAISGQLDIHLAHATSQLILDRGALDITAVETAGQALPFQMMDKQLQITLPAQPDAERVLTIRYRGQPKAGLYFLPDARQVYTAYSTSDWMPCVDAPQERASFTLHLVAPSDLTTTATGELIDQHAHTPGTTLTTWRQTQPKPSYLYGFAAGPFSEAQDRYQQVTLRYLGPPTMDRQALKQVFADTADMVAFFENKAGMPYPGQHYTQVLTHANAAQELDQIAMLNEKYGQRVLADPSKIWLGAHELAHQWWGNGLTNHAWTEMWLNEGLASFMTVAYLEHRFGRDLYLAYIEDLQESYETIRDQGQDKPLIFPDWRSPTLNDRALVYDKGAYLIHQLRGQLGEQAFWAGIKHYTQHHWGRAVHTGDFKRAMEAASGQDLGEFFNRWVYQAAPAKQGAAS
ncbi:aminopeptidase N [Chitinivorax tropicus]|uniref:Aminopeptidase N n=1 Tax=Chitinivorax tropicus TaxID=714531 RepID=A0A840MK96_9PROT|nr:M1 family metallopeptidase [Chitinivorax tropicus]MBB5017579.1 aminopeptidase N [Chitinivorax tropicus]